MNADILLSYNKSKVDLLLYVRLLVSLSTNYFYVDKMWTLPPKWTNFSDFFD